MKTNSIIPHTSQPKQPIPLVLPATPRPSNPCSCGCSKVHPVLSDNSAHYAAWHCTECDRFRGWIKKPKNLTAQQADDELISKLLACGRLNDWEFWFCQSIKDVKNRSPKQKAKLREIASQAGMGGDR